MTTTFDRGIAIDSFVTRYRDHHGKQTDNSSLPAGSPIFYYCKHCGVHTETLPEAHMFWSGPVTVCVPCEALDQHGLIPIALEAARDPWNMSPAERLRMAARLLEDAQAEKTSREVSLVCAKSMIEKVAHEIGCVLLDRQIVGRK